MILKIKINTDNRHIITHYKSRVKKKSNIKQSSFKKEKKNETTKKPLIIVKNYIKDVIINRVEKYCEEKGYTYSKIDGIKVLYDDGFALIRKSNTSPNVTYRYEAKTKERLEEIENEFNNLLNKLKKE